MNSWLLTFTSSASPLNHARRACQQTWNRCRTINLRSVNTLDSANPHLTTFDSLGVPKPILTALQTAFPNVRYPTETQRQFIPALRNGKDILLKDFTGTGKSFGLLLALLSKPTNYGAGTSSQPQKASITSLIIVPHRDLAYQYLHWAEHIRRASSTSENPLPTVQVIVRGAATPLETQVATLRTTPPNILIATPHALLEILQTYPSAIPLDGISTVVADEVDYLIDFKPPTVKDKAKIKAGRPPKSHPTPTQLVLDRIYAVDRTPADNKQRDPGIRKTGKTKGNRPQLIMSSATLRTYLRRFLLKSGWLTPIEGDVIKIVGSSSAPETETDEASAESSLGATPIVHYAIVVSEDGEIKNIEGAVEVSIPELDIDNASPQNHEASTNSVVDDDSLSPISVTEVPDVSAFLETPSPYNPSVLEAIGVAFALDVPRVALLVVPASAPVRRAVYELRCLGINAHGMDIMEDQKGGAFLLRKLATLPEEDPTLLVSTLASTRGMDLPELTHVFVLGVPDKNVNDSYLHVAGRVGRFGGGGKVVSVLEERHEVVVNGDKKIWKDEPKKLGLVFKQIGVTPAKFEHFP